jgi:hypothetical protein
MNPVLRLCEDVFADDGAMELAALPRMLFVVHGAIAIGDRVLRDEEAFGGEGAIMLKAGSAGATVWRWELIEREADFGRPPPGLGITSHEKLAVALATLPKGALLLRGDSVAFPPGGCAYLHRHQGPGIRWRAASASTRMAAPLHTGLAAPGSKPAPTAYLRKRRTAPRVLSA